MMKTLVIGLLIALAGMCSAATQYPVTFGGNFLFYVWGGTHADARVTMIESRLVHVLTDTTLTPADVHVVRQDDGDSVVYVGKVAFATATRHDAALNGTTCFETANHWAKQIRLVIDNITMIAHPSNAN